MTRRQTSAHRQVYAKWNAKVDIDRDDVSFVSAKIGKLPSDLRGDDGLFFLCVTIDTC
jgi:hypothetical protein